MGKPAGKKKHEPASKPDDGRVKQHGKAPDRIPKTFDSDTALFIAMSQDLKEEGKILFQKRDYEGAMLKYEKALNLLPGKHIDVAYIRSNMASCFMQLGLGQYPRAIAECNLALEVFPKYSKALLKRAKCYESLNRLDLAFNDVNSVLNIEPNNLKALEFAEKLRKAIDENGPHNLDGKDVVLPPVFVEEPPRPTRMKEKPRKRRGSKAEENESKENKLIVMGENLGVVNIEKTGVHVKESDGGVKEKEVVSKPVKLAFGDDIRWAQLPVNCSIRLVRDVVLDRFPSLKGILIRYRDQEGDLITITTTDELRLAEASSDPQGSLKLYIAEVGPEKEPVYEGIDNEMGCKSNRKATKVFGNGNLGNPGEMEQGSACIDNWIVQFARLFKNHVGFNSDSYLELHEIGMRLYSEAIEETVTSDEALELFEIAADKFQEMAALALFNWGNVHMSKARKRVSFPEYGPREAMLAELKTAYEWAEKEYLKAGMKYEEALKVKPDFYEGLIALGQQEFEHAKLYWYHAIGNKANFEMGPSSEVLLLYNKAEDSMERGMQMWEEMEEQRLNGICKLDKYKAQLQKMGLDNLCKEMSPEEAAEQAANMRSQINRLWGTLLYERSIVEYKLGVPVWEECLEVAIEKFQLAGASPTDIAVMIKNHCSNGTASEGLGFRIDEIVQAWNEMHDAKRWDVNTPSFRLEPLFRRKSSNLHYILEHF